MHKHSRPENIGKWGTVGGKLDPSDADARACLARELQEEFATVEAEPFAILEELAQIEKDGVLHQFFHVRTTLEQLQISQPEEVLEARFFSIEEVKALGKRGKLYFGQEADFYELVL